MLGDYISCMECDGTPGDQIVILALSRIMGKHCVWLEHSCWTTSNVQKQEDCDVHLVYIGDSQYRLSMLKSDKNDVTNNNEPDLIVLKASSSEQSSVPQ